MSSSQKMAVDFAGLNEDVKAEIEKRICEFEEKHEEDVRNGGPGWVNKIKSIDYGIAIVANTIIFIYYVTAVLI